MLEPRDRPDVVAREPDGGACLAKLLLEGIRIVEIFLREGIDVRHRRHFGHLPAGLPEHVLAVPHFGEHSARVADGQADGLGHGRHVGTQERVGGLLLAEQRQHAPLWGSRINHT
jgi:hypothetical protein